MGQGQGPSWVLEPRSLGPALDAARTPPRLTDQQLWKLMDSGIINLLFETINCDDAPDGEVCSLKYEAQLDYITALLQEQLEHFRSSTFSLSLRLPKTNGHSFTIKQQKHV